MKALIVAKHEFTVNAKRKEFVIMTLLFPAFMILVFYGSFSAIEMLIPTDVNAGFVDESGLLKCDVISKTVEDSVNPMGSSRKYEVKIIRFQSEEKALEALRNGYISLYYVIPSDFPESFRIKKVYDKLVGVTDNIIAVELAKAMGGEIAARFAEGIDIEEQSVRGEESFIDLMAPMLFGVLLFVSIFTTSGYLMQGIIEEKESRVMEILLSSVSAKDVFMGKLAGLAVLGLLQVSMWLSLVLVASITLVTLEFLSVEVFVLSLIYFVLGYLLYSSIMGAIGAISPTIKDAQQFVSVIVLMAMLPVFFLEIFVMNPDSIVLTALSIFPLTSPVAMPTKYAMASASVVEVALSVAVLVATIALVGKGASKIFEMYALSYRKPKVKEVVRRTLM